MEVVVVASGSEGNATLFRSGGTSVLVDAGIGPFALRELLRASGEDGRIDAVVVTHAHQDHFGQARRFARKLRVPVYVTEATARAHRLGGLERFVTYGTRTAFAVGALVIEPVPVPHDEPQVALAISDGRQRVGIATDVGEVTPRLADHLAGCDAVLLESNYDPGLLAWGPYPWFLKQRVASSGGHLSNAQAASLLRRLSARTQTVVLMHLSRTDNTPDIALATASDALAGRRVRLLVARPREALRVDLAPASMPPQLPGRAVPAARPRRRDGALDGQLSLFSA